MFCIFIPPLCGGLAELQADGEIVLRDGVTVDYTRGEMKFAGGRCELGLVARPPAMPGHHARATGTDVFSEPFFEGAGLSQPGQVDGDR